MFKTVAAALAGSLALAGVASAADLPSRAAPPVYAPAPPAFTFTGFYVGTLSGYAFTENRSSRTVGNTAANETAVLNGVRPRLLRNDTDGVTSFGGGVGYDYQFSPGAGLVVGIAADGTLMDLQKRRGYIGSTGLAAATYQSVDTLGTVRGRVGYAFDRVLVYGTGGFAFGGTTQRVAFANAAGQLAFAGQSSRLETGYAYGGGIEYAIPLDSFLNKFSLLSYVPLIKYDSVTLKVEYLRYDLGSRNVFVGPTAPASVGSSTTRFNTEGNLIRGGFSYRFSGLGF